MKIHHAVTNTREYRCLPNWVVRLVDAGRYLAGMMPTVNRYPLADHTRSLSCQPLFIISAGRSGTTLLRSMLVVGGQIAIPPETQVIHIAVRKFLSLRHIGWADLCRVIVSLFESHNLFHMWGVNLYPVYRKVIYLPKKERCLARIVDEVFMCYAAQQFPDATVWGDQSPIYTFFLPRIFSVFPHAKYLHLVRDGRDAIASLVERGRLLKGGMSLEEATYRWVTSVERVWSLQRRLSDNQFLEVRYENLVSEPAETLKKVCKFIGVEYKASMLDFWKSPTTIEHKYNEYHRNLSKPVFTDSIGKWTERLSPDEQQYVLAKTSGLLQRLGYLDETRRFFT